MTYNKEMFLVREWGAYAHPWQGGEAHWTGYA